MIINKFYYNLENIFIYKRVYIQRRSKMANKFILFLLMFSIFLLFPGISNSQPNQACQLIQLTDTERDSRDADVCGDGTGVIFTSRGDILNNGHPEQEDIFFADITDPFNPVFYQLTNTPENDDRPSISDDCTFVSFDSDADYTGMNAAGEDEMFLINISDPNNPLFLQLTPNIANSSIGGNISGDGTKIVFQSNRDYTGMNGDGSREFFVFDSLNIPIPIGQMTNDPNADGSIIQNPTADFDGTRVAFVSTEMYIPPNNIPNGARQLFLVDVLYNPPNPIVTDVFQITNLPNNDFSSTSPTFTPNGNYILYGSNDNTGGMNPDEERELFLANVTNPNAPVITQITKSPTFTTSSGAINTDATSVAFITRSVTFSNGEDEEIILGDTNDPNNPSFISLTRFLAGNDIDSLSASNDLFYMAFESDSPIIGNNPDESDEVFLLINDDCGFAIGRAIPTMSEWGLIAMAGLLGIVGFMVIRRKQLAA